MCIQIYIYVRIYIYVFGGGIFNIRVCLGGGSNICMMGCWKFWHDLSMGRQNPYFAIGLGFRVMRDMWYQSYVSELSVPCISTTCSESAITEDPKYLYWG